jgi:hypothetical protein
LVTDTPQYKEPKRTNPILSNFIPPTYELVPILGLPGTTGNDDPYLAREISFDVVSEDLQEPLDAVFLLDFKRYGRLYENVLCPQAAIPAGRFDDPDPRVVRCHVNFPAGVKRGCRSVTAIVTHEFGDNYESAPGAGRATATWWFQVGVDRSDPTKDLGPCDPAELPGDAGADGSSDGGTPQ